MAYASGSFARPISAVDGWRVQAIDRDELLSSFEESGRGWFWATDRDGLLTYVSDEFAALLNTSRESLLATPFIHLFRQDSASTDARQRLPFILNRQTSFSKLVLQSTRIDVPRWWEVSGKAMFDLNEVFAGHCGFCLDITEQQETSQSASRLALFDALTGLPNRLSLSRMLADAVGRGRRCSLLLLDLDRFKAVNDSLGHPAGDKLLKLVAERLEKVVGDRSKVFRMGGDEFKIILPGVCDPAALEGLATAIIEGVSQPYSIQGTRCVIGASIGIATCPADGETGEDLTRKADLALYAAKAAGRQCYRFFEASLLDSAQDRRQLEEDLRDALARGELSLAYQPLVSTASASITGVEALVRWTHPTRGPISPALFIPIAEEAGLIEAMGEWILRKACDDASKWPSPIRVAINVSPIQFASEGLATIVASALASSDLLPSRLELEITEGVFLAESSETEAMFANLKAIGVRLALDDFGTGYSSLGYLRTAPFDKIKIDQSFVRGATVAGSRNGAIIAAIVALAGALGMDTTAEGIETIDQLELMRELGVSHIQGYVYSKPIANDALVELLGDPNWTAKPSGFARQRADRRSMFRKAGVIVAGHYHPVLIRNLSSSGALVEGMANVPIGTAVILDLGEGQLELARVRRESGRGHGLEFGHALVADQDGALVASKRIATYVLAKHGLAGAAQAAKSIELSFEQAETIEALAAMLGLVIPENWKPKDHQHGQDIDGDASAYGAAGGSGFDANVQGFGGVSPLRGLELLGAGAAGRQLNADEWNRLKCAVEESQNPQLKNIVALVVLTGARFQEILGATWDHIDLEAGLWTIPAALSDDHRKIRLSAMTLSLLEGLPRSDSCRHVIVNPRTKKPYQAVFGSWDAARRKAGLGNISVHDLRKNFRRSW